MHYQQLFEKEKSFHKNLDLYIKEGTIESLEHAKRIIELSIKYAKENQLVSAEKYLQKYNLYVEALIFDYHSPWDLDKLTGNPAAFDKEFLSLVSSDSLRQIHEAETLVKSCYSYALGSNSEIDTLSYQKKRLLIASALSDYNDRSGNHSTTTSSDQLVIASLDSLNPRGVYKWHDYIVVINEFVPKYSAPSLKKGEAIMESDKKLFTYIKKQEIAKVKDSYKIKGTKFLPFKTEGKLQEFVYNHETSLWQYMVCYEVIENSYFTSEVRKYMPPLIFKQEENQLVPTNSHVYN